MAPKLDSLKGVAGISTAVLTGKDGLPLASIGDGAELLAAELEGLRAAVSRMDRRLGVSEISRVAVTGTQVELVALASRGYLLGAALARGQDTAGAQQALAAAMQGALAELPTDEDLEEAEGEGVETPETSEVDRQPDAIDDGQGNA